MTTPIHILIAEDSAADAELFQRALKPFMKTKHLILENAWDGEEALGKIKNRDYDIVFLDMSMPGPTGIEILRYIKDHHKKEKVVIITGYPDLNDLFCKQLGADEYLTKPATSEAIGAILEKYIPSK